ncbi:MAG: protein kinase, partial [Sandaracinaceae bacterium]
PMVLARIVVDACEGLHSAHELRGRDGELMNVVHRDISPQNLFVAFDGNAKILDFGIASASDRLHQTSSGTVKGKFAYMAPEQANGMAIDRRADVWALGVVLWELLAFRRLFRRDTPGQSLAALLHDDIIPPSQVSKLAPPELDDIVLKALQRDPARRYESARELGRDLLRATGRLGDPVDRAEVEEWMDGLFPDGKRRHELMLENARWGEAEATELSEPSSVSEVISRSSWSGAKHAVLGAAPGLPAEIIGDDGVQLLADDEEAHTTASERPPPMRANRAPSQPPVGVATSASSLTPHAIARPDASGDRWKLRAALVALFIVLAFGSGFALFTVLGSGDAQQTPPAPIATARLPETSIGGSEIVGGSEQTTGSESVGVSGRIRVDNPDGAEGTASGSGQTVQPATNPEAEEPTADEPADPDPPTEPHRRRRGRHPAGAQAGGNASGTGTVILSTPGGWANVYDRNGRFLGETPLTLSLPAGSHRLSLRPYGQPPSTNVTVNVVSGQTARVNRAL